MWQKLQKQIKNWQTPLIVAPSVAGLVIAGSIAGVFNLLEWSVRDQFFRMRPAEPIDKRIVIVTIDESDINFVKPWPMSDQVMAQLIQNIKAQQPRGIAIDIYRDLPQEPGHEELVEVFKSTPNVIGIEKAAGKTIAPPPTLDELDQVGANDLQPDADGKIRRGFVGIPKEDGTFREGFGVKLALMYLEKEGIELEVVDEEKKIYKLGKAVFVPLTGNEGEYSEADTGGYQIMLNYRGGLNRFPTIPMQDVLENRIPPELMRDRLVFVGAKAPSLNDNYQTPYTSNLRAAKELTPGVAIHANLASQILSAALHNRAMLLPSVKPFNWLVILFWSGCSATLGSLYVRRRWVSVSGILLAGGIIVISGYVAFLSGWLIPVFTPLLAVVASGVVSIGATLWNNLRLSYEQLEEYAHTLEDKVKERTADLAKANTELANANEEITVLNEKLKSENLRLSTELDVARQMQQLILPKGEELEAIEGLEIAGFMEPADEVGGDYYDVLQQDGRVKIAIGDVTGHGLGSGILMVMAQTVVRTLQQSNETDPVKFLDVLNRTLYQNIERMNSDKNMTLLLLDYSDSVLSVSGQHEEVIVVRSSGEVEHIDTIDLGFPIGLDEDIADFIAQQDIHLNPGDVVVLYSDGIPEAQNMNKDFYGLERLCEVIKDNAQDTAEQIKQAVIEDVRRFIGEQKVFDDITLVVLKQK